MNIESLQERIVTLTSQQEVLKGQYAAIDGHINEAKWWLSQLNKELLDDSVNQDESLEVPQE